MRHVALVEDRCMAWYKAATARLPAQRKRPALAKERGVLPSKSGKAVQAKKTKITLFPQRDAAAAIALVTEPLPHRAAL